MSKRKESYYLGKGAQGWYSEDGSYHIGTPPRGLLKKLYPNLFPSSRSLEETNSPKGVQEVN